MYRFTPVGCTGAAFDVVMLPRQAVVSVATYFRTPICKMFVSTLAELRLAAATERQLRCMRGEELLSLNAQRGVAAVSATVHGDASIRMLLSLRHGLLRAFALSAGG